MKKLCSFFILCLSVFTTYSCKNSNEQELPEGFEEFYEKFHSDSAYQMEHILFPLAGLPGGLDEDSEIDNSFRWYPESWEIHKPMVDEEGEFLQQLTMLDSFTVVEIIRYKKTRFGMERRFAKMGDDWFLIYYVGMNLMKETTDKQVLKEAPQDADSEDDSLIPEE